MLKLKKPLVLVGLMGSGKSTIGYRLATKLQVPFIDTDQLIEQETGCSIKEIFKHVGEEFLIQKEKEVIEKIVKETPESIISLGGNGFVDEESRDFVKKNAISIWLKADLETIVERVSRRNHRPMLENIDKIEFIKKLMKDREEIYSQADIKINSTEGSHMLIVKNILEKLKYFE